MEKINENNILEYLFDNLYIDMEDYYQFNRLCVNLKCNANNLLHTYYKCVDGEFKTCEELAGFVVNSIENN